MSIVINLDKAKAIGHDKRRQLRAEEFAPYDEVIAKQIPGQDMEAAEDARQEIRDKYAEVQDAIDAASTVDELLEVLP